MRRRPRSPLSRLFSVIGTVLLIGAVVIAIGEWGAGLALRKLGGAPMDESITPPAFRANGHGPQELTGSDPKVFVFGDRASEVADGETASALLEQALRDAGKPTLQTFDFSRAAGYSTSERILLEHLLILGVKPDLAVFIDGPGDFANCTPTPASPTEPTRPKLTELLTARSNLVRLSHRLRGPSSSEHCSTVGEADRVIRRLDTNRRIIAALADKLGFKVLFVTLPPPAESAWGYARLAEMRGAGQVYDADQVWLVDVPPAGNRAIADAIAQRVAGGTPAP